MTNAVGASPATPGRRRTTGSDSPSSANRRSRSAARRRSRTIRRRPARAVRGARPARPTPRRRSASAPAPARLARARGLGPRRRAARGDARPTPPRRRAAGRRAQQPPRDNPSTTPSVTNGTPGNPGTTASSSSSPAAIAIAFGCAITCRPMSRPRWPPSSSEATRVTMMPADVEMTSAGICDTRPSPMVSTVYVLAAVATSSPRWSTPITRPPTMLTASTTMPAMASPFTNFLVPRLTRRQKPPKARDRTRISPSPAPPTSSPRS